MTATYDATLIATSTLYYARSRFRDIGGLSGTTVGKPLLTDEEYNGYIARCGAQEGLAQAALSIGAQFVQKVQKYAQSGGIDVVWPNRADFYDKMAQDIRTYGIAGRSNVLMSGEPALPTPINDARLKLEPLDSPWRSGVWSPL